MTWTDGVALMAEPTEPVDPTGPDDPPAEIVPGRELPPMSADVFANALAGADEGDKNYLGDRTAIEALLRVAISQFVDRWMAATESTLADTSRRDVIEAQRLGRIFAGDDPDWLPIADFNAVTLPKLITTFTGIADADPKEVIAGWSAEFFNELHQVMDDLGGKTITLADAKLAHDELVRSYANLAIGIPPKMEI